MAGSSASCILAGMSTRPRIAISVSRAGPDPERTLFRGKFLQYVEQDCIIAVARAGGLPSLLPDLENEEWNALLLDGFDALLLSGGSDVAPSSYGERPLREEWTGDPKRDLYEQSLLLAARQSRIPVLGICRGCQIMNVACGGSLYQDIETQNEGSERHRDQDLYEKFTHCVEISKASLLESILGTTKMTINSVHHQSIKDLGGGLRVTARAPDGVVEAIEGHGGTFFLGVQWHPEWHLEGLSAEQGDVDPLMSAFVDACRS